MKKYIILPFVLFIFSCSERGLDVYGDAYYAAFKRPLSDTTIFSFFFHIDDVIDYPIDVIITGKILESDREYSVEIDEKSTIPRNLVQLPSKFTFKKGAISDKFFVRLTNAPELKTNEYSLILKIKDTDQIFSTGVKHGSTYIKVSDKTVRPEWWTLNDPDGDGKDINRKSVESLFLGAYSDLKYEKFMIATEISDMTGFTPIQMREYSLLFKRWLKANGPISGEDGKLMVVPVIGE